MKSKHLLLTLLLALLVPWAAFGQGTLPIGTGTTYSSSGSNAGVGAGSPMGNTYYYCSTAQFIYTAEELGGAKTINSLAFNHNGFNFFSSTVNIYLTHTTASTVDVNSPATSGTLVYSGTGISLGGSSAGWQTFNFSSNFEYNGTDNLLVVVCRTKSNSGYSNGQGWQYTETTDNKFMVRSSDTDAYGDITNTSYSYTASTKRPNVIIGYVLTTPYITLDPNEATVITGFTQTLTATVGNVSGTPTITYESNDTHVATVEGSGTTATVTGVAPGTATITATMTYNATDYTATCAVTVKDPSLCSPTFDTPSDDYISNFTTTGGVTNISNSSTYETGGYSDYYDTQSASIEAGETLSCTITPSSTQWSYGNAIWVDWNGDFVFADNERVAYSAVVSGEWTGEFAVPATTAAGDYHMRVMHYYNTAATDPCISANYGEAEDYKLTVLAPSAYPKPQSLTVSDLTNISATIGWTAPNEDVTGYQYQYKPEGGEWSALTSTTALSAPLTDLTSNTNYTFQVKAIYSGGESEFASKDFTTMYCASADMCEISYELTTSPNYSSYGWYGSYIKVMDANTDEVLTTWTVAQDGDGTAAGTFAVCDGREIRFEWYSANANNDQILIDSYAIYDANGDVITSGTGPMTTPVNYTMNCPDCAKPTQITVEPSYTTANLSWQGTNDSYNVHYRAVPAIFFDGFENGLDNWTTYHFGDENTNTYWQITQPANWGGTVAAHGGDNVALSRSYYNNASYNIDNWLVTPQVTLDGTLKFWVYGSSYYPEEYEVYVSTSGNAVDDFGTTPFFTPPTITSSWVEVVVDLSQFNGAQGYIALRNHGSDKDFMWIDDFGIYNAGAWESLNTTSTSIELTDLEPGITYQYQVRGYCTYEETWTDWTTMAAFTTLPPVTYTLDIAGFGDESISWYLISSPIGAVNPTNVENMLRDSEDEYDLYAFDQAYPQEEWRNYKSSNFILEPGKGYLYANEQNTTLTFTGEPYTGNGEVTLVKDETAYPDMVGWNLVGNPFGETAYIDRPFYVMNAGRWKVIAATTEAIQPMQGIFVYAADNGETMTFSTTMPAKSANLALNLSQNSNVVDRAIVNFDGERSLPKFQLNENSTKVYFPMEGKDYAVVSAGNIGEMPVNFKAESNGTYTLGFNTENVDFSYLHLIDNMTGADVDLLANPSYSFSAQTTDYASRFKLVFATGSSVDGDNFAFINGMDNLCIFGIEGEATVQVMDALGRVISSETFSGSFEKKLNAAPGVYMIRLIQGNDVKVQKMVIR